MKNIKLKNDVHKISFFTTALASSLTIQLFAQNTYPAFKEPVTQSNIQALVEFPAVDLKSAF